MLKSFNVWNWILSFIIDVSFLSPIANIMHNQQKFEFSESKKIHQTLF